MAEHIPTTSRRWLLAAATPAVLVLSGVAVAAPATINPDAELIALCAEFEVLERKAVVALATNNEDQDRADAAAEAIDREQAPIVAAITACRPTTLAGFTALANIVVLLNLELIKISPTQGCTDERLLQVMLRGMTGRAAA